MLPSVLKAGPYPLTNSAGKVVGACDSMPFDILGRRPWRPRARPAADTDINVEIDEPVKTLADVIPGYNRLR